MKKIIVLVTCCLIFSCKRECTIHTPSTQINWNDYNNVSTIIDNSYDANKDISNKNIKIWGYLNIDSSETQFDVKLYESKDYQIKDDYIDIKIMPILFDSISNQSIIDSIEYYNIKERITQIGCNNKCYVSGTLLIDILFTGELSKPTLICPPKSGIRHLKLTKSTDIFEKGGKK